MRFRYFFWVIAVFLLLGSYSYSQENRWYFPAKSFGKTDKFTSQWYSTELRKMHEPSLFAAVKEKGFEAYRFTCIRSFHPPIIVRVQKQSDASWKLITKVTNGAGGYPSTVTKVGKDESRVLTHNEISALIQKIQATKMWSIPTLHQPFDDGMDGSEWIIELVKDGRYHVVTRWSPPEKSAGDSLAVRDMGTFMTFTLAGLHISEDELY